jgi:uncharacterized PurR-regulated membrane protein YhhQ (DUF165 family)
MEENKKWWQSKTEIAVIVGFIAVLLVNILPMIGLDTVEAGQAVQAESGELVGQILAVASGLAYIVAFVGRFVAKKRIS